MRELPRHLILKDFYLWFNIKEKEEQPTAEFFEVMLDDLLIQLEK